MRTQKAVSKIINFCGFFNNKISQSACLNWPLCTGLFFGERTEAQEYNVILETLISRQFSTAVYPQDETEHTKLVPTDKKQAHLDTKKGGWKNTFAR